MRGHLLDVVVAELVEPLRELRVAVEDLLDVLADLLRAELGLEHVLELPAEDARAPAEVGLEDLPDVHARRNAERVEDDVDRAAVLEVRHVLFGQDAAR